jgi:hypothetical protein
VDVQPVVWQDGANIAAGSREEAATTIRIRLVLLFLVLGCAHGAQLRTDASVPACSPQNATDILVPDLSAIAKCSAAIDPTTEHAVGYLAIAAGIVAFTILAIGFYKLVKLLGH